MSEFVPSVATYTVVICLKAINCLYLIVNVEFYFLGLIAITLIQS